MDISRRAFTLLEVMVVIVILAILASMTIPRLVGNQNRMFRVTCDRIGDMLTMYARRESLGGKPIGLAYDEQRRWLVVHVYDVDPEDGSGKPDWRSDLFIQPVKLPPYVHFVEARADGARVDITRWPLQTRPGHERPTIEIVMDGPEESITIVLSPHAVSARQEREGAGAGRLAPIDLNAAGRTREDW